MSTDPANKQLANKWTRKPVPPEIVSLQPVCPHIDLVASEAGGFVCQRCGLYLFRRPTETG
jgi:hypothetical protein